MKKILVLGLMICALTILGSTTRVSAVNGDMDLVNNFVQSIQLSVDRWADVNVEFGSNMKSIDEKDHMSLYRVFDDITHEQRGYIIVSKLHGIIEAKFKGEDPLTQDKQKIYYVFPGQFYSIHEIKEYAEYWKNNQGKFGTAFGTTIIGIQYDATDTDGDGDVWDISNAFGFTYNYNVSTTRIGDLSHNVVYSSSTMHYSYQINDIPDYLNEHVNNGCAPTATAMLVAYYDNEFDNSFSTLEGANIGTPYGPYLPMFPLLAQDNSGTYSSTVVANLIDELALEMNTCTPDGSCGTTILEWSMGLNNYLDDNELTDYTAVYSWINDDDSNTVNEYTDLKELIRSGNPAVLFVSEEEYGGGHAVIATGYHYYNGGGGIFVHNDLVHGETWITTTYVIGFGAILELDR